MANEGTPTTPEEQVTLPSMEAEPVPAVVAETEKVKGEEAPKDKESYTKEEYTAAVEAERKRYSGLDSKFSKDRGSWETERQNLLAAHNAALAEIEEAKYTGFLAQVENEGGDVDMAKRIVARERAVSAKERDAKALEAWIKEQQGILNEAGKGKLASEMLKEHGLPETHLDKLLGAKDPLEMENLALKLHLEQTKIDKRPPQELDSNQGRKSVGDITKLPVSEALGRLMESG